MSKIDELVSGVNRKRFFRDRYTAERVASYTADLHRVLDLEKKGQPRPALADLLQFFSEEYDIEISRSTLASHLKTISEGREI